MMAVSSRWMIAVSSPDKQLRLYGPLSGDDALRTLAAWERRYPEIVAAPLLCRKPVFRDVIAEVVG